MKRLIILAMLCSQSLLSQAITLTPQVKPNVPDSLMRVSVYKEVKIKEKDLPIKMSGVDVDFVKEYKVSKNGENITEKLQAAIDKYTEGGAKIHFAKGDYTIGRIYMRSNIHLLFEKGTIIRPYSDDISSCVVFSVGNEKDTKPLVENISIQGVGGRVDVLVPQEMASFDTSFRFISSVLVKDFFYSNFDIYDNKTVMPSLNFGPAMKNSENFVGPTNGVIMNMTAINAHYGYGLIQAQAGRNLRFYNLHGIGGITLRMETGNKSMNKAQFGGVWDVEGENISVVNGHGGVLCGPHGMKNGVVHIKNVTAVASGTGFALGESAATDKGTAGFAGSFGAGSSIYNVTAKFGFNAQIKTKELGHIPTEYIDLIGKPGERAIIENAPAHTCVRIATNVPIEYDVKTFHAIGFKYGDPIRITNEKDKNDEVKKVNSDFIMKKYNLKSLDSKGAEFASEKKTKGSKAENAKKENTQRSGKNKKK